MHLNEGDKAPNFKGRDHAGNEVSLSDFNGRYLLLYFYPKDNTPGCTKEACGFRDNFADLKKVVDIVGVSKDSEASHVRFRDKFDLPFPLISDPDKKIIDAYGADGMLFPKRVSFLIDPQGVIVKIYAKVNAAQHAEEVKKDIAAL